MTTKQIRQTVANPTHLIVSDGVDVASNVGYSAISTVLADVESDIAFLTANRSRYIGMTDKPTITDDGVDTITIGAGQAYLCDCEAFDETSYGNLLDIAGASFALATDAQVYYVVAQRTGETAAYALITSRDDVAKPNKALVAIAIRTGTVFHIFEGNTLGVGLPEKIERLLEQRDGFRKVTGIGLSADNSRVVTVASGIVSYGAHTKDLTAAVSNVDSIRFYTWNGTAYTFSLTTLANHTQFNGASGLQTMSNANRFNVNWYWRGAESQKHIYSILSRAEFASIAEALASKPAAPPDIVTAHAVFVGGIVYQRDNATPAGYITPEQAQGTVTVQLHNDLGGLQGGAAGDYQHLTTAQVGGIPFVSADNTFTGLQSFQASASAATFGDNLVTNGTFTGSATGWTLGDGWTYGTDNVVATASAAGTLTQAISVTSGRQYYIELTAQLSAAQNAALNVAIGAVLFGTIARTDITTAHTVAVMLTAGVTGSLDLAFSVTPFSGTGTITIDNIVVREVTTIPATITARNSAGAVVYEQRALTANSNVAVGVDALRSNTTGFNNTAAGIDVLRSNTTGFSNTAAGFQALYSNTTGVSNTAAGREALRSNTTGINNTAAGREALFSNTTGVSNTAAGFQALYSNTTGINNTAAGLQALFSNTTGFSNTAEGREALFSNTTGTNNVAHGYRAGRYAGSGTTANATSNNSTYLGYQTRASASGNTNEVVVGYDVVGAGSNTSTIGNSSTTLAKLFGNTLQLTSSRTPASATAAGAAGEICWDASYLYICTATNTWRRIAHDTWV